MRMTPPASFETGVASHPGKLRSVNEDAFLRKPAAGLWAVADGMGGHDEGRLASATLMQALDLVQPAASAADLLADCESCIVDAHGRLRQTATERQATIGTTLAVLLAFAGDFACIWSGDSRIYRIRHHGIALLSRDHTEVRDLVERGVLTPDEARVWPRRNVITRAIGIGAAPELEIEHGTLMPDDVFVLCSDGLTTHVADLEILRAVVGTGAQAAGDALVALALDRGGTDNVTVLVVRCGPAPC